jgi:hypothetical protein
MLYVEVERQTGSGCWTVDIGEAVTRPGGTLAFDRSAAWPNPSSATHHTVDPCRTVTIEPSRGKT